MYVCKTHVLERRNALPSVSIPGGFTYARKLPAMLIFVSRVCVFKGNCSIDFLKCAICKRCYQRCYLRNCEILKGRPNILLVFSCIYSLLFSSFLHLPQVPRIVFYVSRDLVCMLNKVTFRRFLLRRIICFTPAILSHQTSCPRSFFFFFEERESLCLLLVFVSKEAFSAKRCFESHGPAGLVVKRGLA